MKSKKKKYLLFSILSVLDTPWSKYSSLVESNSIRTSGLLAFHQSHVEYPSSLWIDLSTAILQSEQATERKPSYQTLRWGLLNILCPPLHDCQRLNWFMIPPIIITIHCGENNNTHPLRSKDLSAILDLCLIRIIRNASDLFGISQWYNTKLQAWGLLIWIHASSISAPFDSPQ